MNRSTFVAAAAAAVTTFAAAKSGIAAAQTYPVMHSDDNWRQILGPERYDILRRGGTEPAFSSPLIAEKRAGVYRCAGCSLALFSSKAKYDSGDGWPSFWTAMPNATRTQNDYALVEPRTEVHCRRCGGHLGHIFDDGPRPTHLRYCIDGLALRFIPDAA